MQCEAAVEIASNRKHLLPKQMFRLFELHDKTMTLSNCNQHKYGTYTIPCCVDCNNRLSRRSETPLSEACAGGFAGVIALVKRGGTGPLFRWLVFSFFTPHLTIKIVL